MSGRKELTVTSTLDSSSLTRLLVFVSVQVVVVNMLRSVLTLVSVSDAIIASVREEVPSGFGLVSEQGVAAVLPSKPSVHFLGKVEDLIGGLLMDPMVEGTFKTVGMSGDLLGELAIKSGESVVEGQGVGGEMDPSGVSGEDGKGLSGPETV